jgi:hypothetical protein
MVSRRLKIGAIVTITIIVIYGCVFAAIIASPGLGKYVEIIETIGIVLGIVVIVAAAIALRRERR